MRSKPGCPGRCDLDPPCGPLLGRKNPRRLNWEAPPFTPFTPFKQDIEFALCVGSCVYWMPKRSPAGCNGPNGLVCLSTRSMRAWPA